MTGVRRRCFEVYYYASLPVSPRLSLPSYSCFAEFASHSGMGRGGDGKGTGARTQIWTCEVYHGVSRYLINRAIHRSTSLISLFNLRFTSNLVRYMCVCVCVCVIASSSSIPRTFQSSFDRRINYYYFTICYWNDLLLWRFRINFWRNSFSKIYKIDESMDINEEEFHIRVVIARAPVSSTIHPSLSKFTSVLERCSPSCRKF